MKDIELNEGQVYELSKLLYIGNFMIDLAQTKGGVLKDYNGVIDYVLASADEAGLLDHIKFDKIRQRFFSHVNLEEYHEA